MSLFKTRVKSLHSKGQLTDSNEIYALQNHTDISHFLLVRNCFQTPSLVVGRMFFVQLVDFRWLVFSGKSFSHLPGSFPEYREAFERRRPGSLAAICLIGPYLFNRTDRHYFLE